ncbi:hypothetical protein [Candidatus Protochlamydia phocaeensis]|uniref:hypothetical protein n=1 Tax=Candidatus Protochlamydia phocaeensis TaxID=1414722 RepID=UPI0008397634|nr:hypothetical protein [Candidatus Protochlamydia phocaeensis]
MATLDPTSSASKPETIIEIRPEPHRRNNSLSGQDLTVRDVARHSINATSEEPSRHGVLKSAVSFLKAVTPSSTTTTVIGFVATGVIWAAGQGCLSAGQQMNNPILYAVGTGLTDLGLFIVTGGSAVVGGTIAGSVIKQAIKEEIVPLLNAQQEARLPV